MKIRNNYTIIILLLFLILIIGCEQEKLDTTLPSAEITSPQNQSVVSGIVTIKIEATDNDKISSVELLINDQNVYTDFETPYEYEWVTYDLPDDQNYEIRLRVKDLSGNTILIDPTTVLVNNDLNMSISASDSLLYINNTTLISLALLDNNISNLKYSWSSSFGTIDGSGKSISYTAPSLPNNDLIIVTVTDEYDNTYTDSLNITIYKQLIILKADDFIYSIKDTIPIRFKRFINLIKSKNIKASMGIIGNSLDIGNESYYNTIKEIAKIGLFEFWNHGYDHFLNGINEDGELYDEFYNTSYEHQYEHFNHTQNLAKEKLGLTLHCFGAPGNSYDETTLKVIDENYDILTWFGHPNITSSKHIIIRSYRAEYPTHNPDYMSFINDYPADREYIALQIHPRSWDDFRFAQFEMIIDFLISQKVAFITPYELNQLFEASK